MDNTLVHKGSEIANHFFWVLTLQGILAILISIFVMVYPPIVIPLVAAMFLWQGLLALFLAIRVRTFRSELPRMFGSNAN